MADKICNMNYYFYVDYYDEKIIKKDNKKGNKIDKIDNSEMENNEYEFDKKYLKSNIDEVSNCGFELEVLYPGLLMGVGYEHSKKEESINDFIEIGFSFDYVSGIPYLPASSLKGVLRSVFPIDTNKYNKDVKRMEYIKALLKDIGVENSDKIDIMSLKQELFEKNDVYLDSYPIVKSKKNIVGLDYISKHNNEFGDINVNTIIKVKSGTEFKFNFKLTDGIIKKKQKEELFKKIILDMGVGAKTNVGFGKFREVNNDRK